MNNWKISLLLGCVFYLCSPEDLMEGFFFWQDLINEVIQEVINRLLMDSASSNRKQFFFFGPSEKVETD